MKLYTEDQMIQAYESGRGLTHEEVLEQFVPIQLPTDKEIELKSVEYSTDTETKEFYKDCCWDFQNGAKWMRDKIKGGQGE